MCAMKTEIPAPPAATSATVCIIDDDPGIRSGLARLLRAAGFASESFESGEAFLSRITRSAVGLAVVDVRLGGMSGLQLQRRLRTVRPELQTVIITARDDEAVQRAALSGGAIAFFVKPFEEEPFLSVVRCAMGWRGGPPAGGMADSPERSGRVAVRGVALRGNGAAQAA